MAVQAPLQGSLQFVVHAGRTSFTIHIPMMPTPILRSAMYTNSDDEREVYRSIVASREPWTNGTGSSSKIDDP